MQLNKGTCKSFKIRNSIICTMDNKIWIPNEKRAKFIENTHEILCYAGFKKVHEYVSRKSNMRNKNEMIKQLYKVVKIVKKEK